MAPDSLPDWLFRAFMVTAGIFLLGVVVLFIGTVLHH